MTFNYLVHLPQCPLWFSTVTSTRCSLQVISPVPVGNVQPSVGPRERPKVIEISTCPDTLVDTKYRSPTERQECTTSHITRTGSLPHRAHLLLHPPRPRRVGPRVVTEKTSGTPGIFVMTWNFRGTWVPSGHTARGGGDVTVPPGLTAVEEEMSGPFGSHGRGGDVPPPSRVSHSPSAGPRIPLSRRHRRRRQ